MIEKRVRDALQDGPASGGALLERPGSKLDVRVFGALANLAHRGEIEVVGDGPGERVYGSKGARPVKPRSPGLPPSFSLSDEQVGEIDGWAGRVTKGLPQHYFEELRRALIARADRDGKLDLDVFGAAKPARRYLRRVERGAPVRLRLRSPLRWVAGLLVLVGVIVLLRMFVIGVYTLPATSISMAPALFPAAEGGDALVLANLMARTPDRGEVWIFRKGSQIFVKRVMGLPGERIQVRDGDVYVDGERLVKERALLERMMVRLPFVDRFAQGPHQPAQGYHLPDGSFERADGPVRDIVYEATIVPTKSAIGRPSTFTLRINGHIVRLGPSGFVAIDGTEIAKGLEFALRTDERVDLWVTNADRTFRVEIDGREVARGPITTQVRQTSIEVDGEELGVVNEALYRDLRYGGVANFAWTLKDDEVFVLGDNSKNSYDSRELGPVKTDWLLGRVWAVAWPPGRIRLVR